jgi:hypothetical protein
MVAIFAHQIKSPRRRPVLRIQVRGPEYAQDLGIPWDGMPTHLRVAAGGAAEGMHWRCQSQRFLEGSARQGGIGAQLLLGIRILSETPYGIA